MKKRRVILSSKKISQTAEKEGEARIKKIISQVEKDFEERQKARLPLERQWELNMNFLSGNQYCGINGRGEIIDESKAYFWQNREVFNHIAPIIESRLARFSRVTPTISVRPNTDDDKDVAAANGAEKLIALAFKNSDLESVARKVNTWAETCGTGFYKVVWNNQGGELVGEADGQKVYEGQAEILPVSPFEIFPDSLYSESLSDCNSVIHARAMKVADVAQKYGVILKGEDVGVYSLTGSSGINGKSKSAISDAVLVIERYEKPTLEFPNGRLITVAGGKLLYMGELPYINGENGTRTFPFAKQESLTRAGSFFGVSIIERLIPVQRSFNAVKNRKHEFMNRLSMGVMTVEDGSIDVDDLTEEGLSPGKVLVYRQGSKAPEIMADMTMPADFNEEEEKLINEFVIVSGVSDVSSSSSNARLSSGSALEILVEQDNSRLVMTAEIIRRAYLEIARQTVRLYAQFMAGVKAVKYTDAQNNTKVLYAGKESFNCDEVYLESENELLYSNSQKKEMIFRLFDSGLLSDEEGKLRPSTKEKVLSLLGYKDLDYQNGIARLQEERALKENELIRKEEKAIEEIDDDKIHIDEHTRYVLSEYQSLNEEQKTRFYAHVKAHKQRIKQGEIDNGQI